MSSNSERREEQIKKWEEGKEIVLINDAVVYEKIKNKWGEVKYEDSKKVVKIKKSSKVKYTGKYEVSQDKLNDSTVIYVEVKGKNTRDEDITGYIRSSQINLRSTEEGISKEDKEDKEDKKDKKETTSRATEKDKKKKEKITVGGDKKEYVVAIAAGHNNTDDIGAE